MKRLLILGVFVLVGYPRLSLYVMRLLRLLEFALRHPKPAEVAPDLEQHGFNFFAAH